MSANIERMTLAPEDEPTTATRAIRSIEARARRAAKRVGWVARKSRWRAGTVDNHGEFTIIDQFHNNILYGEKFDLSAEDVIEICMPDPEE